MTFMNFQGPTFTMQVPTDWFINSSPQFQAIFTSPKDSNSDVWANLLISIRPVRDEVTANAIAREAKDTQQQEYPDYEVLEEIEGADDPNKPISYFQRLYRWRNIEKKIHILQCQAYYIYQNRLYTLTATQPSSKAKNDELDKTLLKIMESFTLELAD